MSNPAWQQGSIYQNGSYFGFTGFSEFACNPGQGQIFCPAQLVMGQPAYFELQCITGGYGVGAVAAGIAPVSYSGGNVRQFYNTAPAAWLDESGDVWINGASSHTLSTTVTSAINIRCYWDGAGNIAYATAAANWNAGTWTDADIVNGEGLLPLTGLSAPFAPFVAPYGTPSQTWIIAASSAICAFPAPTNGTTTIPYLGANAVLSITAVDVSEGAVAAIIWAAANAAVASGGLEYSLDGGAWTACGGTVSGTGGTATGPTISDYNLHTIALRETGLILDQTTPTTFIAAVPGTTLVNTTAELGGTSSETFAFGSSYGTIIFALTAESSNEAEYTTPGGQFAFQGGSGQDVENISWVTQGGPPPDQTVISANNVSDFGTLSTGYQTGQITGTLTNLGDSTYRYSITAAGTTVTGTAASGISGFAGFDAIAIRETALTGQGNTWGISVSAPAQEQLTLTSVSTSGGNTLSVGGFCNNAVLEQIDISVNDGGTWAESNSFSSSGGSVAAPFSALGSMLGAGSYEIIVRDHSNPTVESNMLPLTVSGSGASGSRVQVFIF